MIQDPSTLEQIKQFVPAIGTHWFMIICGTSTPQVFDIIISWFLKKHPNLEQSFHGFFTNTKKIVLIAFLAVASILYASFQAWQDEFVLQSKASNDLENMRKEVSSATPTGQQERISELERDLGEANKKLADLAEQGKPRNLDKERLISILKSNGKSYETIVSHSTDLESQNFADQITEALVAAGWKVNPPPFRMMTRDAPGIFIFVQDVKKTAPDGAFILQKALNSLEIESSGTSNGDIPEGKFEIYVGPKKPS